MPGARTRPTPATGRVPDGPGAPRSDGDRSLLPPRAPDGRFVATPDAGADVDVTHPVLRLDRDLSWLEFNRRVLALAHDPLVPLAERIRSLARFHANLDEFFMVRVATLRRRATGPGSGAPRDAVERLAAISTRLRPMLRTATTLLHEGLLRLLRRNGLTVMAVADLDDARRAAAGRLFAERVFPVLTPLAVDPGRPFPYLSNLSISLAVQVRDRRRGDHRFARVKMPDGVPRFVALDDTVLVAVEDLVRAHIDELFPGLDVAGCHAFRVTRDAELSLDGAGDDPLVPIVESQLLRRRFGAIVRLEVDGRVPDDVTALLRTELGVTDDDTYRVAGGLLGGADLAQLADRASPRLRWRAWHPRAHPRLRRTASGGDADVFAEVRRGDILLHHPYDAFGSSVERFLRQAAEDDDVLAIKQTLYRTSGDSRIVDSLARAAERGKQVVVLVEVTARFDEQRNIGWARELERAGAHVVYGLPGVKTHAKCALVVRRESGGLRRYAHVGTGNYNVVSAQHEADVGLLTCSPAIGADLTELFNALTGYGRPPQLRAALAAPWGLRERVVALIDRETRAHRDGDRRGIVRIKVNALSDPAIVAALYRAGRAGVPVRLIVRGICTLRPGIPGVSGSIDVRSTLGRFLEHSRVLQFGPDDLFVGSADLMPRNLDRRVELLVPVTEPALRAEVAEILDVLLADTRATWRLGSGGSWTRVHERYDREPFSAQEHLMSRSGRGTPGRRAGVGR